MVSDPLPLAYAVYAFINVDNCERPLKAFGNNYKDSFSKVINRTLVECAGVRKSSKCFYQFNCFLNEIVFID